VGEKPESRSGLIVGVEWASRVTTIAAGFSLPPLIGFGLDRSLGWAPVATIAGTILGFAVGLLEILALARQIPGRPSSGARGSPESPLPPESKSGPPEDSP
jgi:F0F1-type ATP synthase assembly protein I